ncbi:hypothetical protein FOZ63_024011, partial [Perkinsus olseni]
NATAVSHNVLRPLCSDDDTYNFMLGACIAATASTLNDLYLLGEPMLTRIFGTDNPDCPPPIKLATHKLWSTTAATCGSADHAHESSSPDIMNATNLPRATAAALDLPTLLTKLTTDSHPKSKKVPVALSTLLGGRTTLTHLTPTLHPPCSIIGDLLATDGADRLRLALSYNVRSFLSDTDKTNTYPDGGLKINILNHALLRWASTLHLACNVSLGCLISHCDAVLAIIGTSVHGKTATSAVAEKYHHLMLGEATSLLSSTSSELDVCTFLARSNSNIVGNAALATSSTSTPPSNRKRTDRTDSWSPSWGRYQSSWYPQRWPKWHPKSDKPDSDNSSSHSSAQQPNKKQKTD